MFKEFTSEELNSKVTVLTMQELVQKYSENNFGEALVVASYYTSTWGWLFEGAIKTSHFFARQTPKSIIYKYGSIFGSNVEENLWHGYLYADIKDKPIKFQVYILKIKL